MHDPSLDEIAYIHGSQQVRLISPFRSFWVKAEANFNDIVPTDWVPIASSYYSESECLAEFAGSQFGQPRYPHVLRSTFQYPSTPRTEYLIRQNFRRSKDFRLCAEMQWQLLLLNFSFTFGPWWADISSASSVLWVASWTVGLSEIADMVYMIINGTLGNFASGEPFPSFDRYSAESCCLHDSVFDPTTSWRYMCNKMRYIYIYRPYSQSRVTFNSYAETPAWAYRIHKNER